MKAKNIMDALGGISDDLIEAAENSTPANAVTYNSERRIILPALISI